MKNTTFSFVNQTIPTWLRPSDNSSSIVLSSRVRYARNLAGFPFPNKATSNELANILEMVNLAVSDGSIIQGSFNKIEYISLEKISPLQAEFLLERHLISPDFIQRSPRNNTTESGMKKNKENNPLSRAVFINQDENISLMVNEEDHLRFQVLSSGFDFTNGLKILNELDNGLESVLRYAYSFQYGYLTSCPSNVGTGLRTSVLIHLPGLVLTKVIEKVLRAIWQIGYMVRGFYGEGTETRGHFFQISNTVCLGQSETEIVEGIEKITKQLINYEEKAREYLLKNTKTEIEDKIFRAFAVLSSARMIASEEALNLLATVRLGVAMQIIAKISIDRINEIMLLIRPANLQVFYNQEMTPQERDEKRASLIRHLFNEKHSVDKNPADTNF
jgi:protein arginine kinase